MIRRVTSRVTLLAAPVLGAVAMTCAAASAHPHKPIGPSVYSPVHVTGARLKLAAGHPGTMRIVARGMVNSTGWRSPRLQLVPRAGWRDGLLTYRFVMKRPSGRVLWKYQKVKASRKLVSVPPGTRAIRILGRNGSVCMSLRHGGPSRSCERYTQSSRYSLVRLTDAKIKPAAGRPGAIRIVARGMVNSTGWRDARLQHVHRPHGPRGVLTYKLVMKPPHGAVGWAFQNVKATRNLRFLPRGVRAIRIVGKGRSICIPVRPGAIRGGCRGLRGPGTWATSVRPGGTKGHGHGYGRKISF